MKTQLVPVDPTEKMKKAADDQCFYCDSCKEATANPLMVWSAMIAAAPTPPAQYPYEAACSGLRYTIPEGCGNVAAIHLDGRRWPVAMDGWRDAMSEALDVVAQYAPGFSLLIERMEKILDATTPPAQGKATGRYVYANLITGKMVNAFEKASEVSVSARQFALGWHAAVEAAPAPPATQHYEEQPDGTIHALDPADTQRPDTVTPPAPEVEPVEFEEVSFARELAGPCPVCSKDAGFFGRAAARLSIANRQLKKQLNDDGLRKAAEELVSFLEQLNPNMGNWLNENDFMRLKHNLRAELNRGEA